MKRKDALWVMQMCRDRDARSEAEREAFDTAIEVLKSESLFTADRPRGEWNDIGGVIRWGCSLCHYAYDQKFNFCPNCGADMRTTDGEKSEEHI